jgi:alpha-amylase
LTRSVSLLFGVHAHQPAGNFPEVVDEAHEKSYGPFLRTVHRYPEFRFAVHFSGWLLEQLLERFPEDMALLREMVARGQCELFGGGDMEPVLAAIPARDRLSQLEALSARLEAAFGARPRGAWLTERVWEASVVSALHVAGLDYVMVDDFHFLCAGQDASTLGGWFCTEDGGDRLDLFPISEALRYRFPFAPVEDAVAHLESLAREGGSEAAIYFDDIEKFGIWPETWEWVYGQHWLERFIEAVLASPLIRPRHFADFHDREPGRGLVYLPSTSYMEMGEWSLPVERAAEFSELLKAEKDAGRYERFKPFLRGGIWRNFMSRYPEANWMHKRMLGLSQRLHALPEAPAELLALLHRGQANDAYWHGLFGGLYLPHLRRAVWNALLALEHELEQRPPAAPIARLDADLDGREEVLLRAPGHFAAVRDDGHAAVIEFSALALAHNFGDTLTRRAEQYHARIGEAATAYAGEGIASAHDRVAFRHAVTREDAQPDARARGLFLDSWEPEDGAPSWPCYARAAREDAAVFTSEDEVGAVRKQYALGAEGLAVRWTVEPGSVGTWCTQINLAMPSCDGFLGRYRTAAGMAGGFGDAHVMEACASLRLEDGVLGGGVEVVIDPPARVSARPLRTVSQSEAGFEKVMQAATLELRWPMAPGRGTVSVRLRPFLGFEP